jgi:DNA repair protein RecO (recombination protein O)
MIERTEAIILKSQNWSETSRIVTAFTKQFGRMKFMAKGARKPKSKFGASFQPGGISQLVFYRSRHSELHTVSESDVVWDPSPLAERGMIGPASVALELGYKITALESPSLAFYKNLASFLNSLSKRDENDTNQSLLSFFLSALNNLGYAPKLDACVNCSRELKNGANIFSITEGGFLCPRCHAPEGECVHLKSTQSESLYLWNSSEKLGILSSGDSRLLIEILTSFVNHHISGKSKLICAKYLD